MAASVVDRGGGSGSVGDQSVGDAAGRARIDSYSVVVVVAAAGMGYMYTS